MALPKQPPMPLLFLIGDTGGGHRSAATAVAQALDRLVPGRFNPVIFDPLRGPDVPGPLRWFAGLYGPCIRLTPWLWKMFWQTSGSPRVLRWVRRTLMAPVYDCVAGAVATCGPALVVAFHPMTADPAVRVRDAAGTLPPVITVVTDLITAHLSWRDAGADRIVVPSAAIADACAQDGIPADRCLQLGLPVAAEFCRPPLSDPERAELKRELGVREEFLVVLTGGGEGSGGLRRRAAAILKRVDNVDVAVICGRNRALKRQLTRLAGRRDDGRLSVHGFVGNMADWLRCADIVVGKAGPGTIAEATCCGAPLVLTSFVPGQEAGNAEYVTGAGAGVYAPRPKQLTAEIGRLREDKDALAAMRAASARTGRPGAAEGIALLLARTVSDASLHTAQAAQAGQAAAEPGQAATEPGQAATVAGPAGRPSQADPVGTVGQSAQADPAGPDGPGGRVPALAAVTTVPVPGASGVDHPKAGKLRAVKLRVVRLRGGSSKSVTSKGSSSKTITSKTIMSKTITSKHGRSKGGPGAAGPVVGGPGASGPIAGGPVAGKRRSAVSKLSGPVVRAARRRVIVSSWRRMSRRRWPSPTRIRRRAAS